MAVQQLIVSFYLLSWLGFAILLKSRLMGGGGLGSMTGEWKAPFVIYIETRRRMKAFVNNGRLTWNEKYKARIFHVCLPYYAALGYVSCGLTLLFRSIYSSVCSLSPTSILVLNRKAPCNICNWQLLHMKFFEYFSNSKDCATSFVPISSQKLPKMEYYYSSEIFSFSINWKNLEAGD